MVSPEIQDETLRALLNLARVSAYKHWDNDDPAGYVWRIRRAAWYIDLDLGATYEQWKHAITRLLAKPLPPVK